MDIQFAEKPYKNNSSISCAPAGVDPIHNIINHTETVLLFDIPHDVFKITEKNIVEILTHETIHLILNRFIDFETSSQFDNFFVIVGSLTRFLRKGYLE